MSETCHEFSQEEDNFLLDHYFELNDKEIYIGVDFWSRIRLRMSHEEDIPIRQSCEYSSRVTELLARGTRQMSLEERYFHDNNETYIEDDDNEIEESDDEESSFSSEEDY